MIHKFFGPYVQAFVSPFVQGSATAPAAAGAPASPMDEHRMTGSSASITAATDPAHLPPELAAAFTQLMGSPLPESATPGKWQAHVASADASIKGRGR